MAWHFPEGDEVVAGRVGGMVDGSAVCGGMGPVPPPKAVLTAFISGYLRQENNLVLVSCASRHSKN